MLLIYLWGYCIIMLSKHLIASTRPIANKENVVFWKDYRVTVLQPALFRIEQNKEKIYRDHATQIVWFRDMEKQSFTTIDKGDSFIITTCACSLVLKENREDCRIVFGDKAVAIDNEENLKGTYRTLDCYDGDYNVRGSKTMRKKDQPEENKIQLGMGVCSKKGVATFSDQDSLTLAENGEVLAEKGVGTDEYVFAYGDDYRGAVNALYLITGNVPKIPRFVFGNWWS